MNRSTTWTVVIIILIIILAIIYWIYATNSTINQPTALDNQENQTPANTIQTGSTPALGFFLADSNGKTLYYFANDIIGKSNCIGQCLTSWPAFYAPSIIVPDGLNADDFGQITTNTGASQTTYKGWPLYYYFGDKNLGETNGQGVDNTWFVASSPFYNVMLLNARNSGLYLADARGMALYYNKQDTKETASADPKSICTGQCLASWPAFDQSQIVAPSLLKPSDFKQFTRPDGQNQLSYKGYPLYTYSQDLGSGDTKGHGQNNTWYLVKP